MSVKSRPSGLPVRIVSLVFVVVVHSTGRGAGSVEVGRNGTPPRTDFRSFASGGNDSHAKIQQWFINGIKSHILNVTGRRDTPSLADLSPRDRVVRHGTEGTRGADGSTRELRQTVYPIRTVAPREQAINEIKLPPDEVSNGRNDVLVQFTLQNYTIMKVEGAELMLLLRYKSTNQQAANGVPRKPEVRRVTIEVYKYDGNDTRRENTSASGETVPMTTSVFRIRKTKWAKVLLMRSWIKDAIKSQDKALRLRLVYDKTGSVDVVMMTRDERQEASRNERHRRKVVRKLLRSGNTQRGRRTGGGSSKNLSPILVIRQRAQALS